MEADDAAEPVSCDVHGDGYATYVCRHLAERTASAMFSEPPTPARPWPDAWCERCEELHARHGGWTEELEALADVTLLCSGCYLERRLLLEPATDEGEAPFPFLYRCAQCDATHAGLPAWGAQAPVPWLEASDDERAAGELDDDLCEVGGHHFIRGNIEIPILGSRQRLSWGVWVSLSDASFARTLEHWDDPERARQPACFGWLMTALPASIYPDTLALKTRVHTRPPGLRPLILLEPTEHPLAIDQRRALTIARAEELTVELLALLGGTRVSAPP